MAHHDAPYWNMPDKAVEAVAQHAPFTRGLLEGTLEKLEDLDFNDRLSFANEVVAAQVNLIVDKLRERRMELSPVTTAEMSDSDFLQVIVQDITRRALLRRVRGDDK